jgi:small subunit ribosomal protein S16
MVVIRLARYGKKHYPVYRVTVADQRKAATGKFIEVVGHYNPTPRGKEERIRLDLEKIDFWIKKGAQPSDRVKSLLRGLGVNNKATANAKAPKTSKTAKAKTPKAAKPKSEAAAKA